MTKSPSQIRLNKYIADSGIASRRKADQLIEEGKVIINGKKVYELGIKVDPYADRILISGKPIKPVINKLYYMFHKPKNVLSSMSDPNERPTVADFFQKSKKRIFPVGRLDWDSEGLLLVTNDGDFSNKVMHPKNEITKTYLVKVEGQPSDAKIQKLLRGVSIIGGKVKAKSVQRIKRGADKHQWFKVIITEGKNRQIRRMFEKIEHDVLKLQRVAIGRLRLGSLKRGAYTELTPDQVAKIFQVDIGIEQVKEREQSARNSYKGTTTKKKASSKRNPPKPKRSSKPTKRSASRGKKRR